MKTCSRCKTAKDLSEFTVNRRFADDLESRCRECLRELRLAAYDRKPEHYRTAKNRRYARRAKAGLLPVVTSEHRRRRHLRDSYGITPEEERYLLEEQQGLCPICGSAAEVVDHDHATGRIRGLLCQKCNRGLGHFADSPVMLAKALEYLTGSQTKYLRLSVVDAA